MIEIRKIETSDWPAFARYIKSWKNDKSPFKIESTAVYDTLTKKNFVAWVKKMHYTEDMVDKENWSTATHFYVLVDGEFAGEMSCRWQIDKGSLLEWGGHIGYGVSPDFRGNHLAQKMVEFALGIYKRRGISRVMISANEANLASRKTIENCGGILENVVEIDNDGPKRIARYWIELGE